MDAAQTKGVEELAGILRESEGPLTRLRRAFAVWISYRFAPENVGDPLREAVRIDRFLTEGDDRPG